MISFTQVIVTSAGQVIVGPSFSIVNVCTHDASLPQASITEYPIAYVAPSHPSVPDTNVGSVISTTGDSQEAVAIAIPGAISPKHSTVKSAGQVIVGASFSIVNVCVHDAVLPHASVTE